LLLNFAPHSLQDLPISGALLFIFLETTEFVLTVIEFKMLTAIPFLGFEKFYVWYKHFSQHIEPQKSQDL